jgi:hypothetical protein
MSTRYLCQSPGRLKATRGSTLNGIEFVEVLDRAVVDLHGPAELRQKLLIVQCLKELPADSLSAAHVRIEGGERVRGVPVLWAMPFVDVQSGPPSDERTLLTSPSLTLENPAAVLVVRTEVAGDFSPYRLRLVDPSQPTEPPSGFDRRLTEVPIAFKTDCPSDFDCRTETVCPPAAQDEPEISYLAKDYASFRQLMLDRLSAIAPQWGERHAADLGIALVELLAYVGDHLSYYQDAVATEAYLGTARLRTSVRRHARLVGYPVHDGANARTFVVFEVGPAADGLTLAGPGVQLLTRTRFDGAALDPLLLPEALAAGATVFETMHEVTLRAAHNAIRFHTWSDEECCLPAGATAATLVGPLPDLEIKDETNRPLLLFEEVVGPATGERADADPLHRHAVRLTAVRPGMDEVAQVPIVDVEWAGADALPFPLCLSAVTDAAHKEKRVENVSVARGNVVLADHGLTVRGEPLGTVVAGQPFRPVLRRGPLTFAVPLRADFRARPAAEMAPGLPRDARPAVVLRETAGAGSPWGPQPDLLASDRFAREFVVETEDDGRARLRFGDDVYGLAPDEGTTFAADYRIGNGAEGNVGRDSLVQAVLPPSVGAGIVSVRNPLAAAGGQAPQSLAEVRQFAPQAFRVQERAVNEDDYAAVAERHPEVQKAAATFRWTGSWHTVFLTVDRRGGLPVDAAFESELRRFLDRYRMAGVDLEIDAPQLVALDVALRVCVAAGFLRGAVKAALLERLGGRGFFHPDAWTFGQPVYLSRLYAAALEVEGVATVEVVRFQRRGRPSRQAIDDGVLPLGRLEIARLDNDPNRQENGLLEILLGGGR